MRWLIGLWLLGGTLGDLQPEDCFYILPLQHFHLVLPPQERKETRLASFYADSFIGLPTTSGELFSQSKPTCAHPFLAMGTRVKVTNLANLKSVVLTVNDRQSRRHPERIDLPVRAFRRLAGPNYRERGLIAVRVRILNSN